MATTHTASGFGDLLRRYRLAVGLTQEGLAERAGLSVRGIADLERGVRRTPYPSTVQQIALALQLDEGERAALLAAGRRAVPRPDIEGRTSVLPTPLSNFIGRQREMLEVRLRLDTVRLVTLTGSGGVGKTRLALEVAQTEAARFPAGVTYIALGALLEGAVVPETLAASLGLREQPGRRVLDTLIEHLRFKQLLLVLDNCEHLVEACAELAAALLQTCPGLRILATSREPLGVSGEQLWQVLPLSVPYSSDPDPAGSEAAQLFVERAREAMPDFSLDAQNAQAVAAICRRLDGIPLALELAAAQIRVLSVDEIVARLEGALALPVSGPRTAPARQRTLRATFDWSYALLDDAEQMLLPRLAVFAGGWTLAAAQAVGADASYRRDEGLGLLARLVSKSLVIAEHCGSSTRYRLLETFRAYAEERLEASGETMALRQRHARYYLTLAEEAEPQLRGPQQTVWLNRLEQEHDNLRAALHWAILNRQGDVSLGLAGAAAWFWFAHGHFSEGRRWTEAALAADSGAASPGRARVLFGLGILAQHQDDYVRATAVLQESLALCRKLGDLEGAARSLTYLGRGAREQGDYQRATELLDQALRLAREAGDRVSTQVALEWLGSIAGLRGDYAGAVVLLEESLAVARELGARLGIAYSLRYLGRVSCAQGRLEPARSMLQESLDLSRELGDRRGAAWSLHALGLVAQARADVAHALAYAKESLALRYQTGERSGMAECLEALAAIVGAHGQAAVAAHLFGAAEGLRAAIRAPLPRLDRLEHARQVRALRARLTGAAFASSWAEGSALPLEEVVAQALLLPTTAAVTVAAAPETSAPSQSGLLTRREWQVAGLVAQGLDSARIAEELMIAEGTVRVHVEHILGKLSMHSRTQLAAWVVEPKLLDPPP
jgi:predicted ATPase/DNA-binding NarL/FixJ family response regulator/DNA-binding XRE family transcriptional regulator